MPFVSPFAFVHVLGFEVVDMMAVVLVVVLVAVLVVVLVVVVAILLFEFLVCLCMFLRVSRSMIF